jgi:hypothetical protein
VLRKTDSRTGSLSRGQARKAVLEVKEARSRGRKTGRAKKVPSSYFERYLGHFGSTQETPESSRHPATKRGAAKKTRSKKTTSAAKKYRRAN